MRKIVPIDLGGSPHSCVVAPPRRLPWGVDSMMALVESTALRFPNRELEVAFFHGGFPSRALLDAVHGRPLRLSCHPTDLDKPNAQLFRAAGGEVVELEAMSLDPHVLRVCKRNYRASRIQKMATSLRSMGFSVGIHLVPGLPAQDVEGVLSDVEALVENGSAWVDFVRIWPALGFAGAQLVDWAADGTWHPLEVGQAVNIIGRMMNMCEERGIDVARVGIQPGQDIPVSALAGPVHPNLRGEIDSQRFAFKIEAALNRECAGDRIVVLVNPKDLHLAKGTSNINARRLKSRFSLDSIHFKPDVDVIRGTVEVAKAE